MKDKYYQEILYTQVFRLLYFIIYTCCVMYVLFLANMRLFPKTSIFLCSVGTFSHHPAIALSTIASRTELVVQIFKCLFVDYIYPVGTALSLRVAKCGS